MPETQTATVPKKTKDGKGAQISVPSAALSMKCDCVGLNVLPSNQSFLLVGADDCHPNASYKTPNTKSSQHDCQSRCQGAPSLLMIVSLLMVTSPTLLRTLCLTPFMLLCRSFYKNIPIANPVCPPCTRGNWQHQGWSSADNLSFDFTIEHHHHHQ